MCCWFAPFAAGLDAVISANRSVDVKKLRAPGNGRRSNLSQPQPLSNAVVSFSLFDKGIDKVCDKGRIAA